MKTIFFRSLSILACVVMMSCSETTMSPMLSIKCDVNNTHSISEGNFIQDVDIISLQKSPVMISTVNKVIYQDSIIYILDNENQSLYLYGTDGKFLRAISNQGHASNEYLRLDDFFIDNVNGNINLISQLEQKLLIYSHDATKFLEVKKLPGKFVRMECIEGGYIGYRGNYKEGNDAYNFCIMGRDLIVKEKSSKINPNTEFECHAQVLPFSRYNGKVYFHNDFGLDIFCVENSDTPPFLHNSLDCGAQNTPSFKREDMEDFAKMMKLFNNYVMRIYQFQETNEHLLFLFLYRGQFYLNAYNKLSGVSKTLRLDHYIDKYYFNFGKVVGMTEDCIFTIVNADQIHSIWRKDKENEKLKDKYPKQVQRLREKFNTVDPDGNPFLVTYHIR